MGNFPAINPATGLPFGSSAIPGTGNKPNQSNNGVQPGVQTFGNAPKGSCQQGIYGECTSLVSSTYPDLNKVPCMGNACSWYPMAVKWGWYTNKAPWVGAVACWGCNLPGSGGDGHVAIVIAVHNDGTFDVREENWKGFAEIDTRTVKTTQYVLGFFAAPGGPTFTGSQTAAGGTNAPAPATGARGLRCQFPLTTPSIPINMFGQSGNIGPWSFCLDGMVGVGAFALGLGVMVFAVVLAVRRPAEGVAGRAMEVGGAVTGQPEAVAAGSALHTASEPAQQTDTERMQTPQRRRREPTSSHLSVQQQQTRRELMGLGYSSVQATEAARAAGSAGTSDERLMAGLRSLGR